jgi:plastocyanin
MSSERGHWAGTRLLTIGGLLILSLSGCAADPSDDPNALADAQVGAPSVSVVTNARAGAPGLASGVQAAVQTIDNSFRPEEISISVGTEVVWENRGRNDHDIIPADDPTATSWGVQATAFHPGDAYTHLFAEPGVYHYYCSIHGTAKAGMIGTITVTAP